eukprot:547075_1
MNEGSTLLLEITVLNQCIQIIIKFRYPYNHQISVHKLAQIKSPSTFLLNERWPYLEHIIQYLQLLDITLTNLQLTQSHQHKTESNAWTTFMYNNNIGIDKDKKQTFLSMQICIAIIPMKQSCFIDVNY